MQGTLAVSINPVSLLQCFALPPVQRFHGALDVRENFIEITVLMERAEKVMKAM